MRESAARQPSLICRPCSLSLLASRSLSAVLPRIKNIRSLAHTLNNEAPSQSVPRSPYLLRRFCTPLLPRLTPAPTRQGPDPRARLGLVSPLGGLRAFPLQTQRLFLRGPARRQLARGGLGRGSGGGCGGGGRGGRGDRVDLQGQPGAVPTVPGVAQGVRVYTESGGI